MTELARPRSGIIADAPQRHEARRLSILLRARQYSLFVRGMRFALPALATITLAVIVIWPNVQGRVAGLQISFASIEAEGGDVRMLQPRLTGMNKDGRPYTITAKSAVPERGDGNRIRLDTVDGDVTLANGVWLNLASPFGIYDKFLRQLELTGPIAVHSDEGTEVAAKSALIDLAKGTLTTTDPIAIQGPAGTLEADSAHVAERGALIHFDGHVRGIFYQASKGER